MKKILELKEKRAKLVAQARELVDRAEQEKRSMTQEEENQWNKIMADVDTLGKDVEREERLSSLESQLEKRDLTHKPIPNAEKRDVNPRTTNEYRSAFLDALRLGKNGLNAEQVRLLFNPEVRALSVGTDANGGYIVPDEFERKLIQKLEEENVMRRLATVIMTGSGTREIPVEADYGTAAWTAEGAAYTESDVTFANKTLGAYKGTTIIKVSEELLHDSFFDLEAYLQGVFARRFGDLEEAAFINGDGTGKPTGFLVDSTQGKVGAAGQTTSVTADDFIDTFHALKRPYRRNARWLMNDDTAKAVRKLKDANDQYIWQPGLQVGVPDTILGRPVEYSGDMPVMAANAKSIAFGDFSYYWIADRQGRVMQRLDELYAANGQVGFRMFERVDGKLIQAEAIVYYQNAAS